MSDDQIIASIAKGDISALEQLYNSTYKNVYAFIFSKVKCRHTTEDILHDTYMRIFEKASTYQKGTSLRAWIMTIAKNITYDHFRKEKPIIQYDDNYIESTTPYLAENYENVIDHVELERALKKLSDLDSQIAILYAVCGYRHREIAEILP